MKKIPVILCLLLTIKPYSEAYQQSANLITQIECKTINSSTGETESERFNAKDVVFKNGVISFLKGEYVIIKNVGWVLQYNAATLSLNTDCNLKPIVSESGGHE